MEVIEVNIPKYDITPFLRPIPEEVRQRLIFSLPEHIVKFARDRNFIIAGGVLRDKHLRQSYKDIDIFCGSREIAQEAAEQYCKERSVVAGIHPTAFTTEDHVQFIFGINGTTIADVLSGFDFTINMIGIQGDQGFWHERFESDLKEQVLFAPDPNRGNIWPYRIQKFLARGFKIDRYFTSASAVHGGSGIEHP